MLYAEADQSQANRVRQAPHENPDHIGSRMADDENATQALDQVVSYCQTLECRRATLFSHFGYAINQDRCCHRCNCGPATFVTPTFDFENDLELIDVQPSHESYTTPQKEKKYHIEYLFNLFKQETKRITSPKLRPLSRKMIEVYSVLYYEIYRR